MGDFDSCILGRWLHSHEEDAHGVMVFRPEDYSFPLSRGRRGFEFLEGGEVVYLAIGRGDRPEKYSGSWTMDESNRVTIKLNTDRIGQFSLQVVSCNKQALKVVWRTES